MDNWNEALLRRRINKLEGFLSTRVGTTWDSTYSIAVARTNKGECRYLLDVLVDSMLHLEVLVDDDGVVTSLSGRKVYGYYVYEGVLQVVKRK